MTSASTSFSPALDLTEGVRDPVHYLRELECLRGLAILLVFLFHAWGISGLLLTLASLLLLERVLSRVATMGDKHAELLWHLHHTWEAALWAVIMLCLLLCRLPRARLLVNQALAVAGKLSYSLYLVHVPVLFYLVYPVREQMGAEQFHNSWWLFGISAAALLLSWVSYSLIERPFLCMKRRLAT